MLDDAIQATRTALGEPYNLGCSEVFKGSGEGNIGTILGNNVVDIWYNPKSKCQVADALDLRDRAIQKKVLYQESLPDASEVILAFRKEIDNLTELISRLENVPIPESPQE